MKKYQCHKVVKAVKCSDLTCLSEYKNQIHGDDGLIYHITDNLFDRGKPTGSFYYIEYEDGYHSWSPADVFEKGYTIMEETNSDLIKELEGYIPSIYFCPADVVTCFYGHKVTEEDIICGILGKEILNYASNLRGSRKDRNKNLRQKYNFEPNQALIEAEKFHKRDVENAQKGIKRLVTVPLNKNQLYALTSWVFNFGSGNLKTSTLLRKLNEGDYKGASEQFERWNKMRVNEELVVSEGLVNRRKKEIELFNKAV